MSSGVVSLCSTESAKSIPAPRNRCCTKAEQNIARSRRAMDDFSRTISMMAGAMAKRTGLSPDDLRVRTASGAIFGAIMAATAPWDTYKAEQINADLFQRVDDALAVLQESLRL